MDIYKLQNKFIMYIQATSTSVHEPTQTINHIYTTILCKILKSMLLQTLVV